MVLIGLWLMQLLNRRRMIYKRNDEKVWITAKYLREIHPNDFYTIPIYAWADLYFKSSLSSCRMFLTKDPTPPTVDKRPSGYAFSLEGWRNGSQISTSNGARAAFIWDSQGYDSGWLLYSELGSVISTYINVYDTSLVPNSRYTCFIYYNSDADKLHPIDAEKRGAGVMFYAIYTNQINAPEYGYAFLIDKQYLTI